MVRRLKNQHTACTAEINFISALYTDVLQELSLSALHTHKNSQGKQGWAHNDKNQSLETERKLTCSYCPPSIISIHEGY